MSAQSVIFFPFESKSCIVCAEQYVRVSGLYEHYVKQHQLVIKCGFCKDKAYKIYTSMNAHKTVCLTTQLQLASQCATASDATIFFPFNDYACALCTNELRSAAETF